MKKQITTPSLTFKDESTFSNLLSTIFRPFITRSLWRASKNGGNAILLLFAFVTGLHIPTASAQTCASYPSGIAYVNASATGANNGTSWTDAYTTLQGALTLAGSCPGVTQVWVAAGTYLPTQTSINMSSLYPRHLAFNMLNGLAIYGGFNGTETLLSQRNFISNVTTLSGDIGIPGDNSDNCVHVITNYSLNSTAVLDGFTITAGNANTGDPYVTNQFGGGMYNESASPTVSNCIFTGNAASTFGGGMDNSSGSPVVTNCTFTGNSANFGGGMNNTTSNTSLTNCVFSLNTANSSGGGMYNQSGSNGVLSKCTFKQNAANGLGGGVYNLNSTPGLTNCIFIGNTANSGGGGMFNQLGSSAITNCSFSGNTGTLGGALYSISGTPALKNCILWNNNNGITGSPAVTYSIVQGTGVYAGTGNLNANPLFVSTTDLHLQFGSPAYNTGNNTGAPSTDIEGTSRPLTLANPADMGAYEYVLLPPTIGTYANTTVISGQSTTIAPAGAPTSTTSAEAYTNSRFTGILSVNPTTGVVTVTDAMQAGTYTVTVKASNSAGSATTTFTLTVTNPNCSEGLLGTATSFAGGAGPLSTTTGDFNGDGKLDLAVANVSGANVSIYLGSGTGSFGTATNFAVGSTPFSIAVGEFNGDGNQDLAVANLGSNNVSILLGNGAGSFAAATNIAMLSTCSSVVTGDFNGDGHQDFAATNYGAGSVSIFPGTGTGSFGTAGTFPIGTFPNAIAVGDFNADGNLDIAGCNVTLNTVSVCLGTGTGSLATPTAYAVGINPEGIAIGDFNGDGKQDFVASNFSNSSNNVTVRLGTGTGSFGAGTNFATGSQPNSVSIGDFNGDGKQDLAIPNYLSSNLSILIGTGTGSFGVPTNYSEGSHARYAAIGDYNGDNRLDIAVTNDGSNNIFVHLGVANEINIQGGSPLVSIVDGDATPVATDNTEYGNVLTGNNVVHNFTIQNTGSSTLAVSAITKSGGDAGMFSVGALSPPSPIAAGGSATFNVTFAPSSIGLKTTTVHITNTDCDEGDYDFAVQGTGTCTSITWYLDADNDTHYVSTTSACTSPGAGYNTTGGTSGDCNDNNNTVWQSASFYIDVDADGYDSGTEVVCYGATTPVGYSATTLGNDCKDNDASVHIVQTWYLDADNDTHYVTSVSSCVNPGAGYNTSGGTSGDCNDNDNTKWQSSSLYIDADADGYDAGSTTVCYGATIPSGYSATTNGSDCNDNDNSKWQSASLYIDADADGYDAGSSTVCYGATIPSGYNATTNGSDCDDNNSLAHAVQTWYLDADNDSYYVSSVSSCGSPGAGYNTSGGTLGDCDDNDNEKWQSASSYIDVDADGYDAGSSTVCYGATIPSGYSATTNGSDCNDNDNTKWQSASLYIDADVDGYDAGSSTVCYGATIPSGYNATTSGSDCDDNNSLAHTVETWYLDSDNDSYYVSSVSSCGSPGVGYNTSGGTLGDCDDNNSLAHIAETWYLDSDNDSYYVSSVSSCGSPGVGYNTSGGTLGDCDDNNNTVWQSSSLYIDADADGFDAGSSTVCYGASIPSGYNTTTNGSDCNDNDHTKWQSASLYIDADADGYDAGSATVCYGATIPSGYSATTSGSDCDDNNSLAHSIQTWYLDADNDSYYVSSVSSCGSPGVGYNTTGGTFGDCDDNNNSKWQSASLYIDVDADGYDNSSSTVCYGATIPSGYSATTSGSDCNDNDNSVWQSASLYIDADGDGYDAGSATVCYGATIPSGYSATTSGSDCNDNDNTKWQSAFLYIDGDADGYDSGSSTVCYGATIPSGYSATTNGTDCEDNNENVNPGATEICNSIDDNCNTQIDENGIATSITTSDATTFCAPGTALLNASPTGAGYSYQWYDGANPVGGATNSSYTADASGNYAVTTSQALCTGSSNTISVTENPVPAASVAPIGPFNVCKGVTVSLAANTGVGLTYQWYKTTTLITAGTNYIWDVVGSKSGGYYAVVTNAEGCSATSNIVNVTRLATPISNITLVNPANNPDLCVNGSVKMRGNGSSDISLGYQWILNGSDLIGSTNRVYTAAAAGSYQVRVTNLATGCSTLSAAVAVFSSCKSNTALQPSAAFNVYPNPTDGHFVLHLDMNNEMDGSAIVQVYNTLGQSVLAETVPVTDGEITKELWLNNGDGAGVYFIHVIFNGEVFDQQLIYQH